MSILTCKRYGFKDTVQLGRLFSVSYALKNEKISHYDNLGISREATQAEIKAAYYKMSMVYHPDKNKGCEEAAKKFRAITTAYEVLGNLALRKKYDKGVIITRHLDEETVVETPDKTISAFYRSRFVRDKAPPTGRTSIYDFDEWSRAHYGISFDRKQKAKKNMKMHADADIEQKEADSITLPIFGVFVLLIIVSLIRELMDADRVKINRSRPKSENITEKEKDS